MKTFKEYSDSIIINYNTEILDFCMKDREYCIYEGPNLLLTPGGNIFSHPSEELIRLLVTDLQLFNRSSMNVLSTSTLYSFQKDIFRAEDDPFVSDWESQLVSDPFVLIKTSGKQTNQLTGPDDPLFSFSIITLTGLMEVINGFAGKVMSEIVIEESDKHPFPELLKLCYSRLLPDQKVAVQALNNIHHSGIVLPLLLILDEISSMEYVKGLISLKILSKELYSEKFSEVARVRTYLNFLLRKPKQERTTAVLIREGEKDSIEFKSTLRWDIRAGKTNSAIERASMKTISAFLNSTGGTLLIGVRDDGSIEGIEADKFANDDKFLLHLWTLIRTCLGSDFSSYIRTRLEKTEEKTICVIDCLPSGRPAFLHQPGFDEEMYIRVGPSSNALDISEALKYIEDRFRS